MADHTGMRPQCAETSDTLLRVLERLSPLQSDAEQAARRATLVLLEQLCHTWVRSLRSAVDSIEDEWGDEPMRPSQEVLLLTSGSHRLGLCERGTDIDALVVAPAVATLADFFGSLRAQLERTAAVTELVAIEAAHTPIMTFDVTVSGHATNVDLLFARVPVAQLPPALDIMDDSLLARLDAASARSLNGPRVTRAIMGLVADVRSFLPVLRCVRLWAKRRGIYSNKMGYLGGVHWNILLAAVARRHPAASPARLLERFFAEMKAWAWPQPLALTRPDAAWQDGRRHVMPILTPTHPTANAASLVTSDTLDTIREEFVRTHQQACASPTRPAPRSPPTSPTEPAAVLHAAPHAAQLFLVAGEGGRVWAEPRDREKKRKEKKRKRKKTRPEKRSDAGRHGRSVVRPSVSSRCRGGGGGVPSL
jgi:poly(A) polymerase